MEGNKFKNFSVAMTEEETIKCNDILSQLAFPGEKKKDTTLRAFQIVQAALDKETMKNGGMDTAALDAALENIRNMFVTAAQNRGQIVERKEQEIAEIKSKQNEREKELLEKIEEYEKEIKAAEEEKKVSRGEKKAAEQQAEILQKQLEELQIQSGENKEQLAEKEKVIRMLTNQITASEEKLAQYEALKASEQEAREQVKKLQMEMERKLSDQEKDHELQLERAVYAKERELEETIRAKERENAQLQIENVKLSALKEKFEMENRK